MAYKIPLFDLNFDEKESEAVKNQIATNWISSGPKCQEFESKFASLLKVKHALTITNCTAALHLAFDALGIGDGDEVICPSLTFVATVNAIRYVGATPVFCDITSESDLNIDPNKVQQLITERTKAIIVVHFAGFPVDMDAIMAIANSNKLRVIEDACHGPLSEYNGRKLGTIGDVGCFSFFSNKNISTGEGGMITTNDDQLAALFKLKRSHGMTTMSYQRATGHATAYDVIELGYNFRMDDLRASIGVVQLSKLQADLSKRSLVRKWYLHELESLSEKIWVPFQDNLHFVSNYIFPIVIKPNGSITRDIVRDYLHDNGVQTSVHYPAIHRFSIYQDYAKSAYLPLTEYVADNEITLPMYAGLKINDVKFIVKLLSEIL